MRPVLQLLSFGLKTKCSHDAVWMKEQDCGQADSAYPAEGLTFVHPELGGSDPDVGPLAGDIRPPPLSQDMDSSVSIIYCSWSWKTAAKTDIALMKFLPLPNSTKGSHI